MLLYFEIRWENKTRKIHVKSKIPRLPAKYIRGFGWWEECVKCHIELFMKTPKTGYGMAKLLES